MSLNFIFSLCIVTLLHCAPLESKDTIIVINPAGDAHATGRIIGSTFERSITLSWAHSIERILTNLYPSLQVIITRKAGDILEPLHNASLANRLNADFFLSLHAYHTTSPLPEIFFYFAQYDPEKDPLISQHTNCRQQTFIPYHKAYTCAFNTSVLYSHTLYNHLLSQKSSKKIIAHTPIGIPCTPLIGIAVPACMIEVGIAVPELASSLPTLFVEALEKIVTIMYQKKNSHE